MMFNKLCLVTIIFATIEAKSIFTQASHASSLLNSLKYEEWAAEEEACRTATFSLLDAVNNHTTWATWIWDSMQFPVGALYGSGLHLGSFDQCLGLEAPWFDSRPMDTQYCLVDVTLAEQTRPNEVVDPYGKVEDFVGIKNKHSQSLNMYSVGVCLPRVCSAHSIARIYRHMHTLSHLPFGEVKVDPTNCQDGKEGVKSLGYYAFWFIILLFSATATAVYLVEENSIKNPFLSNLAKWFSPRRNFNALVNASQDEITTLDGLRFLCCGIATSSHYFIFASTVVMNPGLIGNYINENSFGRYLIQLPLTVDIFFLISGMLHMKGLLVSRSGLVKMLIKRYIRFLPALAIVLVYISEVLPHHVSGPIHPRLLNEQVNTCNRNWWLSVLMLNNYVNSEDICHIVTWYLSCDYQLTILGTVIFCVFQKFSRRTAVIFCAVIFLLSLVIPGVMAYRNELPAILFYTADLSGVVSQNRVFHSTYTKSYTRASTYMIGLAMGYLTHVYKPKHYRRTISKTWSIYGAVLGIGILITTLGVGGSLIRGDYSVIASSLNIALDKTVFALGACLIIVVCEYGDCPVVGDYLTSRVFRPLSRLCYGMYLYHPAIIFINIYSIRTPIYFRFFDIFVGGFGCIVVSALMSYLFWFIVEAPAVNMLLHFFQKKGKKD